MKTALNVFETVGDLLDCEMAEMAIVCSNGYGADESVVAYITANRATAPRFLHAIEMEESYSDTLLSFDDEEPPYYGASSAAIDLGVTANALEVDRVLGVVSENGK